MSYKTLGVVTVTKIGTKFENNKKKDKKNKCACYCDGDTYLWVVIDRYRP